jgi:hypothetical protein
MQTITTLAPVAPLEVVDSSITCRIQVVRKRNTGGIEFYVTTEIGSKVVGSKGPYDKDTADRVRDVVARSMYQHMDKLHAHPEAGRQ